jgi:putative ABC transport system permease protein
MPTIPQELRYAVRSLRRSPLVSCFIVATLSACIAAVATVFSLADVVLIRGLPYNHPEQLVWISSVSPDRPDRPFQLPEFMDYRAQARSVRIAGYASWSGIVETRSGSVRLQGLRMSADALSILGATPSLGRLLSAVDDKPGAPRAIMLGYGYWRREFGGDPGIIGRTLPVNGERFTVVGILPRFLPLPVRDVDAVVPLDPESDPLRNERNSVSFIRAFGRVLAPATAAAADAELNTIAGRLREQFPTEYAMKIGARVTPLRDYLAKTLRPTLLILLVCVSLMVAVALANMLNLLLARAVGRQGETAIRLALGASSPRIAMQFLLEGVLLAVTAGAIGSWLAHGAISYGVSHLSGIAPRIEEARLSLPVLGLVFGVCAIAILLFTLVSILIARTASPQAVLQGLGRSGTGSRAQARLRSSFVVAEIALALLITAATAGLLQSLVVLQRVELGYRPDSVFIGRVSLPPRKYQTPEDLARFATTFGTALNASPGVVVAGGVTSSPLSGWMASVPFAPTAGAPTLRRDWPSATYRAVSPGYLEAIAARRIAGRLLREQDDVAAPPVAVVNRTLADTWFGASGAVGRELQIDDNNSGPRVVTIVGVVDDLRELDLEGPIAPQVFIALSQIHPDAASLAVGTQFWAVRLRSDPGAFQPTFLKVLREVDPAVGSALLSDLRSYVDAAIAPRRFSVGLLAAFTSIALLLTMLGVYGVAAYAAEQRRREIGVRMALGATPFGIIRLMLGRTLRLAAIGIGIGLIGAKLTGGLMSHLMFGVTPGSPVLLALVSGFLLITALVASWVPGRRAAKTDVLRALSAD